MCILHTFEPFSGGQILVTIPGIDAYRVERCRAEHGFKIGFARETRPADESGVWNPSLRGLPSAAPFPDLEAGRICRQGENRQNGKEAQSELPFRSQNASSAIACRLGLEICFFFWYS